MSTRPPSSPSSAADTWLDVESADSDPAAAPAPPTDDPLLGTTLLDAYAVARLLGEGGMGRIYEARHVRLPAKRFAIKVLRAELLSSPTVRARFEREAEAVSRISHPGVVGIADVGTTSLGLPFMVCEHLSGLDLLAYLRRFGPLSNERAIVMGCRVAEALEAAHAHGVIHRDVKPSNIFLLGAFEPLGPEWDRVKIIDFGLSRIAGRDDELTATGIVMGTPAYMSPEQARGARTDARTDVYGLGAVLYAAVTGVPPFREKTPQQTLLAVMSGEPMRPRERAPALAEGLELIIQRAMAREPEQRYPNMSALRLALAELELALPAPGGARARLPAPRGVRARFAALAITALTLAAGAIASVLASAPPPDESWTPLTQAAALALVALALFGLTHAARRFHARVWSNTAVLSDVLPRLQAPLFTGLLVYTLTSLATRLAGDPLLALARARSAGWEGLVALPPLEALPATASLLAASAIAAHQAWLPRSPIARFGAPALAAALLVASVAPAHWHRLLDVRSAVARAWNAAPTPATDDAPTTAAQPASAGDPPLIPRLPSDLADAGPRLEPEARRSAPDAGLAPPAFATTAPDPSQPPAAATPPVLSVASLPRASADPPLSAPGAAPDSPEALKAELLAQARRPSGMLPALRSVERLLAIAPDAAADPDVRRTLRQAASLGGEPARAAFRIMTGAMGSHGPDLLYQIMLGQPALADKAKFFLSRHRVRRLFSPELAIAYDLRFSPSCTARLGLLPRASEIGDQRTINTLAALVTPTPGCGEPDHAPCLDHCEREAPQFARAVEAIVRRIRGSERAASAH